MNLFAFWKYDKFPYVLGGEVIAMKNTGDVEVKGYPGMVFKPIKVLPAAAGRKIAAELGALEEEHGNAIAEVNAAFNMRRDEILCLDV